VLCLLLIVLVAFIPLAEASLPDLLWIAGIYDEGDLDRAVEVVDSTPGENRDALVSPECLFTLRATLALFETTCVPLTSLSSYPVRAPPGVVLFTL
jgi:hypothetical protein